MNHSEINEAVLSGRDIDETLVEKAPSLYRYLLNNKIAYYYAKVLSGRRTEQEQKIIERGDELSRRYTKTLRLLEKICDEAGVNFLLYKTHRYIDEVVDGDIDILIQKKDFLDFMGAFRDRGFECVEDEPGKGKCVKEGYSVIEPHTSISWRGIKALEERYLWDDAREIVIDGVSVMNCSPVVEAYGMIGELLFSPEYIDLLSLKKIQALNLKELPALGSMGRMIADAYRVIRKRKRYSDALPYFLPTFLLFSTIRATVSFRDAIEICFKNVYWKIRYKLLKKLPFTHDWKV